MNLSKAEFIQLAIDNNVLKFGRFTLKSGRISPYFFNAGEFYHGQALSQIGKFYAKVIIDNQIKFEHLFGPAYKGLPLATATAIALAELGINKPVAFNRKEEKDHGEGGVLIGGPLTGKTIIIDDVISAGTAFRQSKTLIETHGAIVSGVVIALDRCERGTSQQSTLNVIENMGVPVFSIVTLYDVISYLRNQGKSDHVNQIQAYIEQYGCH